MKNYHHLLKRLGYAISSSSPLEGESNSLLPSVNEAKKF